MKKDLYQEITNKIIEELENGIIPWRKPWTGVTSGAISHTTGRPYSIINQYLLRKPGEYITFNQAKKEGGRIKKGAKAQFIVFWKVSGKQVLNDDGTPATDEEGNPVIKGYPILKYYNVFHIDDCEVKGSSRNIQMVNSQNQRRQTRRPKEFLMIILEGKKSPSGTFGEIKHATAPCWTR